MKRFFILMAVMVCAATAFAARVILWEGSWSATYDKSLDIPVCGYAFQESDKLILTMTKTGDDNPYLKICADLQSGDNWVGHDVGRVEAGTYTYAVNSDAGVFAVLSQMNSKIMVQGEGFILNKLEAEGDGVENITEPEKPEPAVPDAGYNVITLWDESKDFSDWELFELDVRSKLTGELTDLYPGDRIRITSTNSGSHQLQWGYLLAPEKLDEDMTVGFHNKNDGHEKWASLWYAWVNGLIYVETADNVVDVVLTEAFVDALNADPDARFILRSPDLNLSKVELLQVAKRRKHVWLPLFIPGEYPTHITNMSAKNTFGSNPDKTGNPADLCRWMGTGIIRNVAAEGAEPEYVYQFDGEWWDEGITAEPENNARKIRYAEMRDEKNSYPLRLMRENTPNFSKLKFGDVVRITVRVNGPEYTDLSENPEGPQAQLGTYDPAKIENLEDPYSGFVPMTLANGLTYRDWGADEIYTQVLDFTIDQTLLDHITRYGLTINGRMYSVMSVMAKVYVDDDDYQGGGYSDEEYFFNHTFDGSYFQDLTQRSIVVVSIGGDKYYDEHRTNFYTDADRTSLSGYKTETLDADNRGEVPADRLIDGVTPSPEKMSVSYFNPNTGAVSGADVLVRTRFHRAAYLYQNHFPLCEGVDLPFYMTDELEQLYPETAAAASKAPRRAPRADRVVEDNSVKPVDGVGVGTHVDPDGRMHFAIAFYDKNILDAVKANGIAVRGKQIGNPQLYVLRDAGDLTGVEDAVAADSESIDYSAPYELYNMQGMRVAEPVRGTIYIVKQGLKVEKKVF
ncbi:MAG: hypothetical protein NC406_04450 [Bacteroides sp.]|nr:hypothetical protein [Bacteroides sp.]MCM1095898.1 hypothetical protein [Terasakiella sp.]